MSSRYDTKNLRVLIVEDQPERQNCLKRFFKDHSLVLAQIPKRAIRLLEAFAFDLISLDSNLAGPGQYGDVAAFVSESRNAKDKAMVHSVNAPDANQILALIPGAELIPITKMTRDNRTLRRFKWCFLREVK